MEGTRPFKLFKNMQDSCVLKCESHLSKAGLVTGKETVVPQAYMDSYRLKLSVLHPNHSNWTRSGDHNCVWSLSFDARLTARLP